MISGLGRGWSLASYLIAAILVLPLFAIFMQAMLPDEAVFPHLWNTVLPSYIINSLLMMLGVGLGALLFAVPAAWLVARCHFPGRKYFQWALLLPLAMPAYIVAYIYTDLLDYSGPVQASMRRLFGWSSMGDYYFPEVRSLPGAALMLALVLFPYVYLLARSSFMEQSSHLQDAAKVMGYSAWQSFWHLSLPMARPALAVGLALVAMETMADFATVNFFAVPTLTTAVYDTWLSYGSLSAASKLSVIMLVGIFALVGLERFARRKQQLYQKQTGFQPRSRYELKGFKGAMASGYCLLLLALAFLIPLMVLLQYVWDYLDSAQLDGLWQYSLNSLGLALLVSLLCVLLAMAMMFVARVDPTMKGGLPARIASTGYALPGTVLAIGVLAPLTQLDFFVNDAYVFFGYPMPGLIFTGSIFALAMAFCIRFIAIAIGSIESSYKRISPSLDMANSTLGQGFFSLLWRVHLPLLRKGIFAAMLLVFIECMKELPAALLLRPVGFENLATYVYQFVSDEQLEHGALGAITIILVGLVPVIYLNRSLEQEH